MRKAFRQLSALVCSILTAAVVAVWPCDISAGPASGEQIKWQVLSGGGSKGSSTNYAVAGTIGQTAAGPGNSTSYRINSGFWQNFQSAGNCCFGATGNVDCDASENIDISDLTRLIDNLFVGMYPLCCPGEANTDGDLAEGIDISDVTRLIDFLFINFNPTANCL